MSATYRTIFKNTAVMTAGRLVSQVSQFVMFIYAARSLGAVDFGIYSFANVLVMIIGHFMDMGLYRYCIQQTSRNLKTVPMYLGASLVAKFFLIIIGYAMIMGAGLALNKDALTLKVLLVLATAQAFHNLAMPFDSAFAAQEKMQYSAVIISVSNIIMSLSGIAFLYYSRSVLLFSIALAIGAFLRFILMAFWYLKKNGIPMFNFDFSFVGHLVKKGVPFLLSIFFISIYNDIDSVMLDMFDGEKTVGYYNAAYRLIEAPLLISESLIIALFPAVSRLYQEESETLKTLFSESFYKSLAFGLSVACVTAFLSKDLILFLYGPEYVQSGQVLPILIFGLVFIMPASICGTTLRSTDRQTIGMFVGGGGVVLNIMLNLILIPKYSLIGAAWATLATEVIVAGIYIQLVRHYVIGNFFQLAYLVKVIILPSLLFIFLFLTASVGLWFQVTGCIILFFPCMLLSGVMSTAELRSVFSRG